jgi:thiol:disulfide interchange protein DsbC
MRTVTTTAPVAANAALDLAGHVGLRSAEPPGSAAGQVPSIARMARLPVGGVQVVENPGGELLFLSDNGRYALRAPALDLWRGAKLFSFEETLRLSGRIVLGRLKLDVGDLGAIDLGEEPEVVVVGDPLCPHCAALGAELQGLFGSHRFRLVPVPFLGEAFQCALLPKPGGLPGPARLGGPQPSGLAGRLPLVPDRRPAR